MPVDLSKYLTIAISSRALFDLEAENDIFEKQGADEYEKYQMAHESEVLKPGAGFPLVKAILKLNSKLKELRKTEVVVISRNNPCVGLRLSNSISHYDLDITRAAFTSGRPVSKYLESFGVTLFLSRNTEDVKKALRNNIAAGLLYAMPENYHEELDEIRVAFDGDAVIFSDESEKIFKSQGLESFEKHEKENANNPLAEGHFTKLLKALSFLQKQSDGTGIPIRLALITARSSPAHERVIRTLRAWDVRIDEMFFMGGVSKDKTLKAFHPHIYFDDQAVHCDPASKVTPTARVPL